MIKLVMTKITLKDTGYRTVSGLGEETEKAPGDDDQPGTTLTLNVEEISYGIPVRVNDAPIPNRFENDDQNEIFGLSEVDTIGVATPVWTIRGVFDMESESDRKLFAKLVKMAKTKGVKELTGVTPNASWINYINYYDDYYANESKGTATTISHVHVRVANFTVKAPATSKYARWSMELRETR